MRMRTRSVLDVAVGWAAREFERWGVDPGVWRALDPLLTWTKVISALPSPIVTNWHKWPPAVGQAQLVEDTDVDESGRRSNQRPATCSRVLQASPCRMRDAGLGPCGRPTNYYCSEISVACLDGGSWQSAAVSAAIASDFRPPFSLPPTIDGSSLVSKWQFLYAH